MRCSRDCHDDRQHDCDPHERGHSECQRPEITDVRGLRTRRRERALLKLGSRGRRDQSGQSHNGQQSDELHHPLFPLNLSAHCSPSQLIAGYIGRGGGKH